MDLKRIIQEVVNDFSWIENIPNTDLYRYFEVYVCGDTQYDEETGEDECVDGGSYFFKIPTQIVPEIWDYEADDDYYAGPGDEGLGVIEWAIDNDIMIRDDYAIPEYVTEKTKKEFCLAWGNYNDKEVCKEFVNTHWLTDEPVNESSDFTWVKDVTPRVFDLLYIATKDNPRINVHFSDGGDFTHINDHNEMNYFDGYDIGKLLEMDPEEVYNISKEDLMRYIMVYHILGGGWNGNIDPDNIKGSPLYDTNEDYRDFVDLYELLETL